MVDYLFKPITRKDQQLLWRGSICFLSPNAFFAHGAPTRHRKRLSECRVLSWDSADAATERAIASIGQPVSHRFGSLRVNGYSVALLSNPLGQLPPAILALPMRASSACRSAVPPAA